MFHMLRRSLAGRALLVLAILAPLLATGTLAMSSAQAQTSDGDADCSDAITANDALVILETRVGLRTVTAACPLSAPRTQMNLLQGDYSGDSSVTILDALMITQCCDGAPGSRFTTLPPGSALPTGADCAARIRPRIEDIPENAAWNERTGASVVGTTYLSSNIAAQDFEARVVGDFTGTTDEIIQWAACKWGFDENHIRAQAFLESSWFAGKLGDCGRITIDTTLTCASVGLIQVRAAEVAPVHPGVMPWAWDSTSFNLDYAMAVHRACFEGLEPWLAGQSPNGVVYEPGDLLGCSGRWYSGKWHNDSGLNYMAKLQEAIDTRKWRKGASGCVNWQTNEWCRPD